MNRYMTEKWSWIEGSHDVRTQMLALLRDEDLAFSPGGQNITLGALCREMGETEHSYVQSLKNFQQDWSYRNTAAGLESSVSSLNAWMQALDDEMKTTVAAFSDEDLRKTIDRNGFSVPVDMQLDIYLQALLIFFGKAAVYYRAMDRTLPQGFTDFIG